MCSTRINFNQDDNPLGEVISGKSVREEMVV